MKTTSKTRDALCIIALLALCVALGLAAACDDADDAGAGAGDGDADSDADGDGVPYCARSCDVPADCVPDQSTVITDADNWSCDGHCAYQGCNSDAECDEAFSYLGYGCTADSGWGDIPACAQLCSIAADCATEYSPPAYDADNYACNAGGYCKYQGCNSDAECEDTVPGYQCLQAPYLPVPICMQPCQTATDCDFGHGAAYGADNYACVDQVCLYTGCNSTAECQDSHDPAWECVQPRALSRRRSP